jgi:hypothetical protein
MKGYRTLRLKDILRNGDVYSWKNFSGLRSVGIAVGYKVEYAFLHGVVCFRPITQGKRQTRAANSAKPKPRKRSRRAARTGVCQRLSARQRKETPAEFRDVLLDIARSVKPENKERVLHEERPGEAPNQQLKD